jgi:putative transposase
MHVPLVVATKYRRGVFTKEILGDQRIVFASVCTDFESELVEFDGEDDHVHLLVNDPPKVAVSALVNSLKGVSSRMIRQKNYPAIRRKLWDGALWSPSYFAGSCGGAPARPLPPRSGTTSHDRTALPTRKSSFTSVLSGPAKTRSANCSFLPVHTSEIGLTSTKPG